MTHENGVDDGDLEIEEWERADALLAAQGYSEGERRVIWNTLKSPKVSEAEVFLEKWAEERGVSLAEAHRQIHEANGTVL